MTAGSRLRSTARPVASGTSIARVEEVAAPHASMISHAEVATRLILTADEETSRSAAAV